MKPYIPSRPAAEGNSEAHGLESRVEIARRLAEPTVALLRHIRSRRHCLDRGPESAEACLSHQRSTRCRQSWVAIPRSLPYLSLHNLCLGQGYTIHEVR